MPTIALTFLLVFYAPACRGINGNGRHFANGDISTPAQNKLVVACPVRFKFGTRFLIHGLESRGISEVVCVDRGGAIRGNMLDVFVMSGEGCAVDRAEARRLGRKHRTVEILN